MDNLNEEQVKLPDVQEPYVRFRLNSDKKWMKIMSEDENIKDPYVVISGYDLNFDFNFELIKNLKDVVMVTDGIADMFKQILLDELLKQNKQN